MPAETASRTPTRSDPPTPKGNKMVDVRSVTGWSRVPDRLRPWTSRLIVAAVAIALAEAYLLWAPLAPDLAAQVARAHLVREHGAAVWWTGWFGGISTPSYSVLMPSSMAVLGVRASGALSIVLASLAADRLLSAAPRRRAGVLTFAALVAANALDGRVTFGAGVAAGTWALVAVRDRYRLLAAGLSVATFLCSPLAALFLGIVMLATAFIDADHRRRAIACAAIVLAGGLTMQLLFPGTGTMPYHWSDPLPAAAGCVVVAVFCRQRVLRFASLLMLVTMAFLFAYPGAVGANITRLSWLCAAPLVVAFAQPRRRILVLLAAVGVAIWPAADLTQQLSASNSAAAHESYYGALSTELRSLQSGAGPSAIGERVEVVDPINHWSSAYLGGFSLARGWDRQADAADNPIFYNSRLLTPAGYRGWLDQLAVAWVARPMTTLDYASRAEAALIDHGLPYLHEVWSDSQWRVYAVENPAPLANGARVTAIGPTSVTVQSDVAPTTVRLRMRWSPYLALTSPGSGRPWPGCIANAGGWIVLTLLQPGVAEVHSDFSPGSTFADSDAACARPNPVAPSSPSPPPR
ncbi:MAG: hypothetical protein JO147_13755 [Actinobacteria bacterium]|nr:hypothetical protein [Actinomycetota bacterium]